MKIIENLEKIIKNLDGNLLGIGIKEERLIDAIDQNKKIQVCNLLDSLVKGEEEKGKSKKIPINKIRKKLKKKKTDYILCNVETINKFKEKFVYDSIYLSKKEIYLYGDNNIIESIISRYKRFCNIEIIECKDGLIYKLQITKKMTKINEKYYNFLDSFLDLTNLIGDNLS